MDVYLVYNDDSQVNAVKEADLKEGLFFHFIDERTKTGLKEAWKVKSHLASRVSPFAAIYENDNPIKAFYSEADDNIIQSLIEYLKK